MAFKSDAQRRHFFARYGGDMDSGPSLPYTPKAPSFGWNESPTRADKITDRIQANEERIRGSGVGADFAERERDSRDAFIAGDAQLSDEEKRKLLAYSGAWRRA